MMCARQLGLPELTCNSFGDFRRRIQEDGRAHAARHSTRREGIPIPMVNSQHPDNGDHECDGISFKEPTSTMESGRAMDGFVDDTTAWAYQFKKCSRSRDKKLQQAQHGEEFLHSTGGELELSNCIYYSARWKWSPDGSAYLATPEEI